MTRAERAAISREWFVAGEDALRAANALSEAGHYRSCVSRSYYAAYAFLAALLVREPGVTFQGDREGPEHDPLADMVREHLRRRLSERVRQRVQEDVQALYRFRLLADYRPRASVREGTAVESLQRATAIANNARRIEEP